MGKIRARQSPAGVHGQGSDTGYKKVPKSRKICLFIFLIKVETEKRISQLRQESSGPPTHSVHQSVGLVITTWEW